MPARPRAPSGRWPFGVAARGWHIMAHLFLLLTQSQHHFFLDGCGGECPNLPYQNSSVSAAQLPFRCCQASACDRKKLNSTVRAADARHCCLQMQHQIFETKNKGNYQLSFEASKFSITFSIRQPICHLAPCHLVPSPSRHGNRAPWCGAGWR
jgi:hypothetical protein